MSLKPIGWAGGAYVQTASLFFGHKRRRPAVGDDRFGNRLSSLGRRADDRTGRDRKRFTDTGPFKHDLAPVRSLSSFDVGTPTNNELRAHPETARVREAILAYARNLPVLKVKIYDLEGLTVFSTQESQIGEDKSTNSGVISAISGKVASELTHRNTFSAFEQTIEDRDVLSSYVPIRNDIGQIEGVFEVYSDLTPLLVAIKDTQFIIVLYTLVIFVVLYAALFLIVRRAETIMRHQQDEVAQSP